MDFNGKRPVINHMMVRVGFRKLNSSVRKRDENDLLVGSFEPPKRLQGLHFITVVTKIFDLDQKLGTQSDVTIIILHAINLNLQ